MKSIISTSEFKEFIQNPNAIIIDARPNVQAYQQEHINNSFHLALEDDLSDSEKNPKNGGRHPLPTPQKFSEKLSNLGIDKNSTVLIYDENNGAMAAARLWWMIKSAGIEIVGVLNGGLKAAKKDKIATTHQKSIQPKPSDFKFEKWNFPLVNLNEVIAASQKKDKIIVDVRSENRYKGLEEPIDPIAGHIPNAKNIPYEGNLDENGNFLAPEILKEKYQNLFNKNPSDKIIFHCGSGVTACHSLLALDYADFEIPNLYVGSWSEWCRNDLAIS